MALSCPRDRQPLKKHAALLGPDAHGFSCGACAGVLVDWETAERFLKGMGIGLADLKTLVAKAGAAPTTCPACTETSRRVFRLGDTELDICESCGHLWFDRGELQRLSKGTMGTALPSDAKGAPEARVSVAGVYEMWWNCSFCDTKGLLGKSNRHCPNCGAAQDATKRYFPPEGKEAAYNGTFEGADRTCPACSTPNGAKAHNCRQCGSPLDGASEVARVADFVPDAPKLAPLPKKRSVLGWVVGLISTLTCGFCGLGACWTKDATATVTGHQWERSIAIEAYDTVRDQTWCDSMPSGARERSRSKAQRSTRQVPDGETCSTRNVDRGDGTFEKREECRTKYRDEPVYDMECQYEIERWHTVRTAREAGTDESGLKWPRVSLSRSGTCVGCEREGARKENYELLLKGPAGEAWRCSVPLPTWQQAREGSTRQVQVRVLTDGIDCGSL
jgi:hypothetical protein